MEQYIKGAFIGRMQPFHRGHMLNIRIALEHHKEVVVLVGSANRAQSHKNPFTFEQREEMIRGSFNEDDNKRITILPLGDEIYTYDVNGQGDNQAWAEKVRELVGGEFVLFGHTRDASSFYQKYFNFHNLDELLVNGQNITATKIRNTLYYNGDVDEIIKMINDPKIIPKGTKKVLQEELFNYTMQGEDSLLSRMIAENTICKAYPEKWGKVALTGDALIKRWNVEKSQDEYLFIRRKTYPGYDTLAIPGGFVEDGETPLEAALRELFEETQVKIDIQEADVLASFTAAHPDRDLRARIVSGIFLIQAPFGIEPKETEEGRIVWLSEYDFFTGDFKDERQFFADHFFAARRLICDARGTF